MSGVTPSPPEGWYLNPEQPDTLRWWDGSTWGPVAPKPPLPQARTSVSAPHPQTQAYLSPPAPPAPSAIPGTPARGSQAFWHEGPEAPRPSLPPKVKTLNSAWAFAAAAILVPFMMGSHRMYLGRIGTGLLMLAIWLIPFLVVTFEIEELLYLVVVAPLVVFPWWVVDVVRLRRLVEDANYR